MPYGDKTGPNGSGPRNGRGYGNCNGQGGAGRGTGRGKGRGAGQGMGRGQGRGRNTDDAGQGTSWLASQLSRLEAAIEKLTARTDKGA